MVLHSLSVAMHVWQGHQIGSQFTGFTDSSMSNAKSSFLGKRHCTNSPTRRTAKAALVTPCLSHLPFHPSCLLGYGAAVLAGRYDLDVIDLNAELHLRNRETLQPVLEEMDKARVVSDALHLYPWYKKREADIEKLYDAIPWEGYPLV